MHVHLFTFAGDPSTAADVAEPGRSWGEAQQSDAVRQPAELRVHQRVPASGTAAGQDDQGR